MAYHYLNKMGRPQPTQPPPHMACSTINTNHFGDKPHQHHKLWFILFTPNQDFKPACEPDVETNCSCSPKATVFNYWKGKRMGGRAVCQPQGSPRLINTTSSGSVAIAEARLSPEPALPGQTSQVEALPRTLSCCCA